jgi:hypothetical protein
MCNRCKGEEHEVKGDSSISMVFLGIKAASSHVLLHLTLDIHKLLKMPKHRPIA